MVGREIIGIHAFYETILSVRYLKHGSGKKLGVSIRVKIVNIRTSFKCFEALKYIITLLIHSSSYHTSRIIPLNFVTHLILCYEILKFAKELGLPFTVNFNITPHMVP